MSLQSMICWLLVWLVVVLAWVVMLKMILPIASPPNRDGFSIIVLQGLKFPEDIVSVPSTYFHSSPKLSLFSASS
uniref:Putative secreted protein n=1 Tax=Anopheles darlingi TaxID=43151 RepID=A0A2M4D4Z7_ANODA